MLFISSFLLPLATAALIQLSLAAPVTSPHSDDVNTTIPRYIIHVNPDSAKVVQPTDADQCIFLTSVLSDFDDLLNHPLILSWHKDTFNGFSGRFKESHINILSSLKEIDSIIEGLSLITTAITILMIKPMSG